MICADVFRLLPGLEVLQLPHIVHATDGSIPSLPTWTMSGSTSAQYQLSAVRLRALQAQEGRWRKVIPLRRPPSPVACVSAM